MAWQQSTLDGKEEVIGDLAPRVRVPISLKPRREIEGDVVIDSWFFGARELVFKKGARLIFSQAAIAKRSELFVVAKIITVEDGVGTITCQSATPPAQGDRGQAASGGAGTSEGGNGAPGADGLAGVDGLSGQSAPDITVFVSTLSGNGNLEISTGGGQGGAGGIGQRGGDGGAGARGSSARQAYRDAGWPIGKVWLPACEAGPGRGGDGGAGGAGGGGGRGGKGGRGGNATLCTSAANQQILTQAINVVTNGGQGGPGGPGAAGGNGGGGGTEGQLANFCNSAGRYGSAGATGPAGTPGPLGEPGEQGAQFVVTVESTLSDDWFGL